MWLIRAFEEKASALYAERQIVGLLHLGIGQEAVAVGVCSLLSTDDLVYGGHRSHGHAIAKGADPARMYLELYGRAGGYCGGKGGSMHIADLSKGMLGANGIVGGGPPLICGAALAAKTMKTGGVAIALVGDGGSNQGTTFESYNLAKVWNLPAIFIVEDNGYAESTASKWSVGGSQVGRGNGFGLPSMEVDGSDFFVVYEAAREAIDRARAGGGPTLIHMKVMRYYGHFEGDAATYKAADEVAKYKAAKDPLNLFRNRVTEAGLLEGKALDEIDTACKQRIQQCVALAKSAKSPTEADLLTDVYTSAY